MSVYTLSYVCAQHLCGPTFFKIKIYYGTFLSLICAQIDFFFASIRSRNGYFSHTATRMRTTYRIHYPPDFHKLRAVREYADFVGAMA